LEKGVSQNLKFPLVLENAIEDWWRDINDGLMISD